MGSAECTEEWNFSCCCCWEACADAYYAVTVYYINFEWFSVGQLLRTTNPNTWCIKNISAENCVYPTGICVKGTARHPPHAGLGYSKSLCNKFIATQLDERSAYSVLRTTYNVLHIVRTAYSV